MAVKTRDKILNKALILFNEQGERMVTTNHIASALNISPGNLYYHFKNKDEIILELLKRLMTDLLEKIQVPEEQPLKLEDKRQYLEITMANQREYRFVYRDIHGLSQRSEVLREAFQFFTKAAIQNLKAILNGLKQSGIIDVPENEIEALAMNHVMVISSWQDVIRMTFGCNPKDESIAARRAIYQLLLMDKPYIQPAAKEEFDLLVSDYYVPLTAFQA